MTCSKTNMQVRTRCKEMYVNEYVYVGIGKVTRKRKSRERGPTNNKRDNEYITVPNSRPECYTKHLILYSLEVETNIFLRAKKKGKIKKKVLGLKKCRSKTFWVHKIF